jgi:hypothetical protein
MRVPSRLLLLALALAAAANGISGRSIAQEIARPSPGGPLRHDEDWAVLRDPARREGQWWEPYKFIPFDDEGEVYLTLGVELRARYEYLSNPNWGEEEEDRGGYLWLRALPTADLHLGQRFRLFGEMILAQAVDVDPAPSTIDEDVADILQAFGEVAVAPDTRLRAGRQILNFGSGRLISTRYGTNVIRTFDTAQVLYGEDRRSLFLIYGRPVSPETGGFDDEWSATQQFWSVYGSRDLVDAGIAADAAGVDLYYIGFEDEGAVFDQGAGRELRHTVGLRIFGRQDRWDWNHELFGQFGRFAGDPIEAWSLATEVGHRRSDVPFAPRFSVKFNVISGDEDRHDGTLGTFNPLFPSLKYFGEPAVIAPYNLIDLHPTLEFSPMERIAVTADVDFMWRYSTDDGLYGAGGRLLRSGAGSDARYIATQFEVVLDLEVTENWELSGSYAAIPAGSFIRDTGSARAIHFAGFEAKLMY